MNDFDQLTQLFVRFPGIGPRQARRFVYFLLRSHPEYIRNLTSEISNLHNNMHICRASQQFFYDEDPNVDLSPIERDSNRNSSQLMVVVKDMDLENIEQTKVYRGKYFVLGGLIPIVNQKGTSHARTRELLDQIEMRGPELDEIIFALPVNPEGEHTQMHLMNLLEPLATEHNIAISVLGRGLSTGTELEYIDRDTMESAFGGRG